MTTNIESGVNDKIMKLLAVESLKRDAEKSEDREIAKQFGVSVKVVREAKERYFTKFRSQIDNYLGNAPANRLGKKQLESQTAKRLAGQRGRKQIDTRGYKGRNGRVELLDKIYDKYGLDADASFLLAKVNEASVKAGLPELKRSTFYSMLSIARNGGKQASGTVRAMRQRKENAAKEEQGEESRVTH